MKVLAKLQIQWEVQSFIRNIKMKITVSGFDPIITDKGRMSCELMLTVIMIFVKEQRKENAT
jgi:hypothetical protein